MREDAEPLPLTDYSRFKLDCERDLLAHAKVQRHGAGYRPARHRVRLRPAPATGSDGQHPDHPRARKPQDPHLRRQTASSQPAHQGHGARVHAFLEAPGAKIDREAFNVGFQNRSVEDIAGLVRSTLGDPTIELEYTPSNDNRSYHVNSEKVKRVLGFETRFTIEDAICDIADAIAGV